MDNSKGSLGGEPAVDLSEVFFSYGNREVLEGLSLQISSGEVFGLLGANGAGKTTLIRILVGLAKPRSGRVMVLGQSPAPGLADRIGYMPQLNAIYLELSVVQNVDFFARMYGLSNSAKRREAVGRAIDMVALGDRRNDPVIRLSGGMRQRVSLAIALVHSPDLLLLDEPTVGLDPELRAALWDHFRGLATNGTTLIVSSHTTDDAAHCDQLAFIQGGVVVAKGSPLELRDATGSADATLEEAILHLVRKARGHVNEPNHSDCK